MMQKFVTLLFCMALEGIEWQLSMDDSPLERKAHRTPAGLKLMRGLYLLCDLCGFSSAALCGFAFQRSFAFNREGRRENARREIAEEEVSTKIDTSQSS